MKNLITVLLLLSCFPLFAQNAETPLCKDFKIVIEETPNGVSLKGLKGTAWTDLNFTMILHRPQAVDEYGMADLDNVSPDKDPNLADYLFTITKTEEGIVLRAIEGTTWKELSFNIPKGGKQTIDQNGMTEM